MSDDGMTTKEFWEAAALAAIPEAIRLVTTQNTHLNNSGVSATVSDLCDRIAGDLCEKRDRIFDCEEETA